MKKDPSVFEREEMDKIGRIWVSIARRDIPKHHRIFNNFHRKQLADAKRCSENCQREVCYVSSLFQLGISFIYFLISFLRASAFLLF